MVQTSGAPHCKLCGSGLVQGLVDLSHLLWGLFRLLFPIPEQLSLADQQLLKVP